jgi:hypothetical protein
MSEKPKKVFIVGCAPSRDLVPWDEVKAGKAEAWGVNNLFHSMPLEQYPFTRFFEIHHIDKLEDGTMRRRFDPVFRGQKVNEYLAGGTHPQTGEHIKGLADLNIPVYMQKLWPEVPNAVVYPLEQMVAQFGDYFTNTISFELALAITEGFEEIHVYGVDMAVSSKMFLHNEYSQQRPSCEFFLGIAMGKGIKIFIPDTSDLLKTRFMYAYEEPQAHKWQHKTQEMLRTIGQQKAKAINQKHEMQRKEDQALGAELAIMEMDKIWQ